MNVLIPNEWLKDYIKTNAKPEDIAKALSLHAFSVEKVTSAPDGDFVYEVEITPNRGDGLSVLGIARELKVILPRMGFKVEWVEKPIRRSRGKREWDKLDIEIKDKTLVPRFSAIVLDNVKIKESPDFIKRRLENVGIRPINVVVDVTNYMMIERGQPMHAFDYDKISNQKMVVRESKKGEELTTLDGVSRKLPEGVIVIEDGKGRLIDLCGIMGGQNSEIDSNTKKVLLFVQVYDPVRIRKASMSLGHRTDAALRFEKGVDFGGVLDSLWKAVEIISDHSGGKVSSKLIDILNKDQHQSNVEIDYDKINLVAGMEIKKKEVDGILANLGFIVKGSRALVPSWREGDVLIPEDLAEEVVRIYGYYNLPSRLFIGKMPENRENESFYWEDRIKDLLKYLGFFEVYTLSATNKNLAGENPIPLRNPYNEDFAYLKTSLLPLLGNLIDKNKGYAEKIKVFELAPIYLERHEDIPNQPNMLAIITLGLDELELKGYVECILNEMGIKSSGNMQIHRVSKGLGVELNFDDLVKRASKSKTYVPVSKFNSIKEDLTLTINNKTRYQEIESTITESDERIVKVEFKDIYLNNLTLGIEYLDKERQISSEDTQIIRQRVFNNLEKRLGIKLKAQR